MTGLEWTLISAVLFIGFYMGVEHRCQRCGQRHGDFGRLASPHAQAGRDTGRYF